MKTSSRLLPRWMFLALIGLASVLGNWAHAQEVINAAGGAGAGGVIPASYQGSGSFFNRQLGTVFRFSYHNQGYGTQDGVATLGSMKVFNLDDSSTIFLDGQATLSEDFGGGFNTGIGYRQLVDTGMGFDSQRILGVSFWTDGQSTSADNFFTQLGFNLESLGESFDARIGGYFPLDRTMAGDTRLTSLNDPMFLGNNLVGEAFMRSIDTAHSVVDGELAKRIGNLEAWAFLGGYQLGGGNVDATGYRVGARGYAMPDLLLSLQVTDDDVYKTNVMVGLTWFVGRTHRGNQPCGTLLDRFREPVMRNDFIATTQVSEMVAGGDPLRDATTGDDLRFVHIDSNAAAGGDGTFENPLTSFAGAAATSVDNDTVLVHAGSAFGGQYALKDGQRVIGEGGGIVHTTNTLELGVINLPETSLGALAGAVPVIAGVGDVFTMADNNEINNLIINGGTRAVVADAVASPTLRNLVINNPTGDGVTMTNITGTGTNSDLTIATTAGTGFLANGGGTINATGTNTITTTTGVGLDLSNVSIGATNFTFDSVNVINGGTTGINLDTLDGAGQVIIGSGINAGDGGTLTVAGTAIRINSVDNATFSNVTVNNTAVGSNGVVINSIFGDEAFFSGLDITTEATGFSSIGGGELSVTGTNTISTQTGTGLRLDSNVIDAAGVTFDSVTTTAGTGTGIELNDLLTGTVTVGPNTGVDGAGGTLTTAGTAISVDNVAGAVFNDITIDNSAAAGEGINVTNQTAGTVRFENTEVTTSSAENAVTIAGNTSGTIEFDTLMATTTGAGDAVSINEADASTVVMNFNDITVNANGAGHGFVALGGGVTTITGTNVANSTGDTAFETVDVQNLSVSNLTINNTAARGIEVLGTNNAAGTVTLTNVNVTTTTADAVAVENNSLGTITFNGLTTTSTDGDGIILENNTGVILAVNNFTVMVTGTGDGFTATGGGTLTGTGTNTVSAVSGQGVNLTGMTIGAADLRFDNVTVTAGTATGINLDALDGTGQVIIGSGINPGDGGMLTTTGTAIRLNDVNNATFSNVTVANTAVGANGVEITSVAGNEAFFSGLNITTENTGFSSIGGGELSVTDTNNITTTSGTALQIRDNVIDVAGVTFDNVTTTAGTGTSIELADLTGGTVTVGPDSGTPGDGGTLTTAGTAISVDNVASAVFNDLTVANTTGPGVNVTGQTAGSVLFNNLAVTTTTADGVTVENNTGGTIGFDGLNVTTTTGDTIVLDNNTGATVTINDMVVNSTVSGNGLTASNGGSLSVTGTNTIDTVTGVGLDLSGVTILAAGATFESVDVTAGATNGIALSDLAGGVVTVGANTGTAGDGGMLTTTGTAILVDNVASATFNDVMVNNLATAGQGIEVTSQIAGSTVRFENAEIDTSSADAVRVRGNTAGTITFDTLAATTTGAGNGISVDELDLSTIAINFNDITVNANGTGNGFNAIGGGVTTITGTNAINSTGATAFLANNVQNLSATGVTIANTTQGGVEVLGTDNAAGAVNLTNFFVTTTTADAVRVAGNTMGTITFNGLATTSTNGDGVTFSANAGATLVANNLIINVTGSGDGFTASGGGTLTGNGTNSVDVNTGQGVNVSDMTIGAAGLMFGSVNVTAGTGNGISLSTLTGPGQLSIGSTGGAAGSGGTLTTAGTAIRVNNVDNLAISRVTINNTTGQGVDVTGQDGGTAIFTGLDITTTTVDGVSVDSNTGGSITFNELLVGTTDGDAVVLGTNAGATVNFSDMTLSSTGTGNGFAAIGGGTLNVTGTNSVTTDTGQVIDIANMTVGANGVTIDEVNTVTGAVIAIELDTITGGFIRIGSGVAAGDGGTLISSDTAIRVNDVDDVTFTNITINNTAVGSDGVIVTNSAGDRAFFSGLNVTSERTGFSATGGELGVTGTNTIATTTGPALVVRDLEVNIAGVTFDSVSTSAGTGMGIELENLTGGTVTVGPNTGVDGAGGTLVTAGNSISVTNVAGAVFNDVEATSSGGSAATVVHTNAATSNVEFDNFDGTSGASNAVTVQAAGAGELDVTLRDSTIESTGAKAVLFDTDLGSDRVDFTLTDNTIIADDNFAVDAQLDGGTGDIRFLFEGNTVTNDSAASATMNVAVTSDLTLNATIGSQNVIAPLGDSNSFDNADAAGTAFALDVNDAGAVVNLDLRDNTASGGAVDFILTETAGAFGIVDLSATVTAATNNVGAVSLGGNVEADFDDLVPPIDQVTP